MKNDNFTEKMIDTMYLMQIFSGYMQRHSALVQQAKKDPHDLRARSELEKTKSNLNSLEPVLAKLQGEIKEHMEKKYDIIIQ